MKLQFNILLALITLNLPPSLDGHIKRFISESNTAITELDIKELNSFNGFSLWESNF